MKRDVFMKQKDMINRCKERGLSVTLALLYRQGKKHGFLVRNNSNGRERYDVDEVKFNKWLNEYVQVVPEGYISIGRALHKYNLSYQALKYQLKKNDCEIKKLGVVHGGLYCAKQSDVERAVAQYHKRSSKE